MGRRRTSCTSQCTLSWYPMSTSKSVLRLWKPPESVPTSTWPRCAVRTPSTCESDHTHTTSLESTRCCRALVPIGSRPVCEVPTVSQTVSFAESTSVTQSSPSEQRSPTTNTPTRLSDDPRCSSQDDKRSTDPRTGVSPSSPLRSSATTCERARSSQTETAANTRVTRARSPIGRLDRPSKQKKTKMFNQSSQIFCLKKICRYISKFFDLRS